MNRALRTSESCAWCLMLWVPAAFVFELSGAGIVCVDLLHTLCGHASQPRLDAVPALSLAAWADGWLHTPPRAPLDPVRL